MKRFLLLAAFAAVLTQSALGAGKQSETTYPPAPTAAAINDSTPLPPLPPSEDEVTPPSSRRVLRNGPAQGLLPWREQAPQAASAAPNCCTPAASAFKPTCSMPAVSAYKAQAPTCAAQAPGCSTALPAKDPSCAAVTASRPHDPTCAAAKAPTCEASEQCVDRVVITYPCDCCQPVARRIAPLNFLVKEFVRKPFYGMQKAATEAESRRLAARDCLLQHESERLAGQAYVLANKAASTCPCDACAKHALCRQEVRFATEANRHALKVAELEAKQAENDAKAASLRAKHCELFHN